MILPQPGERVVEVPQAHSLLLLTLPGRPVAAVEPHLGTGYGWPRWITYQPGSDPAWGYGLLVPRDGVLLAGPAQWDSSD